ncbi:MAG: NIPSNAP family protein [Rhodococcus sp. (in: high G+C Gram-positive bacteria)]
MTICIYELRTYTLTSAAALLAYETIYYPNHVASLRELYAVTVHGFWSATDTDTFEFYVLLSYPESADPVALRKQYRSHPDAAANMPGFDPSVVTNVSVTMLVPATASPLR